MDDRQLRDDDVTIALEASVPLSPLAPRAMRAFLEDGLSTVGERPLKSAQLLVSEVLSMSVRHSALPPGTPVHVAITVSSQVLRVAVEDPGWAAVVPPSTVWEGDAADFGMLLLPYLADRWGVDHGDRSPVVWFELELN